MSKHFKVVIVEVAHPEIKRTNSGGSDQSTVEILETSPSLDG